MADKLTPGERFILNESPELSVGENQVWLKKFFGAFPALENRNYRMYFIGQLVSMIGNWMQIVALSWLVLKLTDSIFTIGMVMALSTLPTLLFTLFGGVLVDRFPKKDILFFTQITSMVLATILGLLTIFEWITVWEICVIAFLLGTINAIDAPARQAFVSELVNIEQLSSAIALNSGVFNTARVIGPTIAGVLIAVIGTGGAFLLNALSYSAVMFALHKIDVQPISFPKKTNTILAIKEGISYSLAHPIIRTLFIIIAIISIFGWSYTTVLPVIVKRDFHAGAAGLGYLYAASGLGSLLATIIIAVYSKRISPLYFIIGGTIIFSVSIFGFSFAKDVHTASILLFFSGFGLLSFASQSNTTIQSLVKSEYRGRVMSIYVLLFIGLTPIGNIQIGFISEHLGTEYALRIGAGIVLIAGLTVFFLKNRIRNAYNTYKNLL